MTERTRRAKERGWYSAAHRTKEQAKRAQRKYQQSPKGREWLRNYRRTLLYRSEEAQKYYYFSTLRSLRFYHILNENYAPGTPGGLFGDHPDRLTEEEAMKLCHRDVDPRVEWGGISYLTTLCM